MDDNAHLTFGFIQWLPHCLCPYSRTKGIQGLLVPYSIIAIGRKLHLIFFFLKKQIIGKSYCFKLEALRYECRLYFHKWSCVVLML